MADTIISDNCASQVNALRFEAHDGALCSPSQKDELLATSQGVQLLEDPIGLFDNDFSSI